MAMDEAKHLEVLTRYYRRLERDPLSIRRFPAGYLFQSAIVSDDPVEWLTGSLVSEVLSKNSLEEFLRVGLDPVLDDVCRRILEDEARHLGFNHVFLADRFQSSFGADERGAEQIAEQLGARLEAVLDRVPPILEGLAADMRAMGLVDKDDFFERLREECRTRLRKSVSAGRSAWKDGIEMPEADGE